MPKALSQFKVWFLILCLGLVSEACTKKSRSPKLETADQSEACTQINLVRDASWTSGFVKGFVSCLSESSESSRQKFALTLSVLNKLGDQGLQSTLDMFRFQAQGKEVFFGLASSVLDRGTADQDSDRWPATQVLLEDTKPFAFVTLLLELKKRDLLSPMLDALESADKTLPNGFIETAVRQFLNDPAVKADTLVLVKSFLADEEAFRSFNRFLTPERKALDRECSESCVYPGAEQLKSSAQHWLDFWSGLPKERRDRLALSMAQIMKGTLEQEDGVARDRGQKIATLAIESILRSSDVYQQLYEALDVVLETPLSSYEPFIEGLNRVKDNPIYLDAFQEKIGSSQLEDLIVDFLWKGGQPQACSQKVLGVSSGKTSEERASLLQSLLSPHTACEGKTPVLVQLSQYLGYECSVSHCSIALFNKPESGRELNKSFVLYHLEKLAQHLPLDPYSLYRLGGARDKLSKEHLEVIRSEASRFDLTKASGILAFESAMLRRFPRVLSDDWLTMGLNQSLADLSEVEQSFKGLYPDRDPVEQWYNASLTDPDAQLSRVVYGLYHGGSAEQAFNKLFSLPSIESAWKRSHPDSRIESRELAQIVAPLRSLGSFYKNPAASFKPELEKISLPWVGSIRNSATFGKDGSVESRGDALQYAALFDQTANGLSLLSRFEEQLPLATASVPQGEAEELRRWLLQDFLPTQIAQLKNISTTSTSLPAEFFTRTALSPLELRTLNLFLGTQFAQDMSQRPEGAKVSATPETNSNPKTEAARSLGGTASIAGVEKVWTSFWLFQSDLTSTQHSSLSAVRKSLVEDADSLRQNFAKKTNSPVLISQGLLDLADAEKLNSHEKNLVQLQLMSPILENRGKQFFVPSVGFDSYCPKKQGQSFVASNCPFAMPNYQSYAKFLDDRFTKSFCAVLPRDTQELASVLKAMGYSDNSDEVSKLCGSLNPTTRWNRELLSKVLKDAMILGKNPRLNEGLRLLPSELAWLKSVNRKDPKEALKTYLSYTPVLDGLSSTKVAQRSGLYQAFYSRRPGAVSVWLLYLGRDIGLRGVAESLKRLGSQGVGGSDNPVRDLLGLVATRYEMAKLRNASTLEFALDLVTEVGKRDYARESLLRILGKPYDPYTGILFGYTMPQAIEAGIFPSFNWETYAPLRLLLQNQNLDILQGLGQIYDRDALDWLDHWLKITAIFPSTQVLAEDVKPMLLWLRAYAHSRDQGSTEEIKGLAALRSWDAPIDSATRIYRQLRVSLPDLSGHWHEAFYFESAALSRTLVETLPKLLSLKDQFELQGGDQNLMAEALLGLIQGPLKHDGQQLSRWLQDARMGFRAPSFWGEALRDPSFRESLNKALTGFENTERDDWKRLRDEWDTLAPEASHLIDYMAKNVVPKNDNGFYQKSALLSLSRATNDKERWDATGKVLKSWLDDESVLKAWQSQYETEAKGN